MRMEEYYPPLDTVQELSEQGCSTPIWRELPADLETPVSVYLKLRGTGSSFLLESVEKGEQLGRYSFLGVEPTGILTARDGQVSLWEEGSTGLQQFAEGDPLAAAEDILSRFNSVTVNGLQRFTAGWLAIWRMTLCAFLKRLPRHRGRVWSCLTASLCSPTAW